VYCAYDARDTTTVSGDPTDAASVLSTTADVCTDKIVTALALTTQQSHPIVVLGTKDGFVMKVNTQVCLPYNQPQLI